MASKEEIERLKQGLQMKAQQRAAQEPREPGPSLGERLAPTGRALGKPLAPVGRTAEAAIEYPIHGMTEDIQRFGEMREVGRREGAFGVFKQFGRESLSDVFDIAADVVPGGIIPESLGERLDPSQETELGMALEREKERFRNREGRDPSIIELYDMKTQLQDVAMPSLTKRRKIGPLEFSNRALLEAGGEVGAAAGEILFTGGAATLARGIGKVSAKTGAKVAASQMDSGAVRAALGKVAGEAIKKTGTALKMPFMVPTYIDNLAGAMIGTPLRWGVQAGALGVKGGLRGLGLPAVGVIKTAGGVKMVVNHFRRNALEKGADPATTNEAAMNAARRMVDTEGAEPGTQLSLNQWYETGIDRAAKPQPSPGNRLYDSFADPATTNSGRNLAAGTLTWQQIRRDQVRSIVEATWSGITSVPHMWRKPTAGIAPTPPEEKAWVLLARRTADAVTDAEDGWQNRKEAMVTKARAMTSFYLKALEDKGMLHWNVGGYTGRWADQVDANPDVVLASGNSAGHLVRGEAGEYIGLRDISGRGPANVGIETADLSVKGNLSVRMPAELADEYSLRGNTQITPSVDPITKKISNRPLHYLDPQGNPAGPVEWKPKVHGNGAQVFEKDALTGNPVPINRLVATNLDPALRDVIEQLNLYRPQLRAVKNVVQRVDADGNLIPDSWMNAYEVFEELASLSDELEGALKAAGSDVAGTARSVHAGGTYYPSNPLVRKVTGGLLSPDRTKNLEIGISVGDKGKILPVTHTKERVYASQAEGQWDGNWYIHPAATMDDYANFVAETIMAKRRGDFVTRIADQHGIDHATAKTLLGSDGLEELAKTVTKIKEALAVVVARRKSQGVTANNALIRQAKKLFNDMAKLDSDDELIVVEDGNLIEAALDRVKKLMPRLQAWDAQSRKIAADLKATAPEIKQLEQALKKAKAAHSEYKKHVEADLKSIAGVGIESISFPKVFAEALRAYGVVGDPRQNRNFYMTANSMLRIMGATGDFSAIGIQGHVGVMNDAAEAMGIAPALDKVGGINVPRIKRTYPAFRALTGSFKAFAHAGDQIVGEYFWRAEQIALQTGNLTPTDLANNGLAVLQNAPDIYYSKGLRDRIGIKNVDAAFTHYGNILRHETAQNEIEIAMLQFGKTAQELVADGTVAQISRVANLMSGVGKRGFMGDFGNYLLFAPRFMHARMKMLVLMSQGLMPYGPKSVQQKIAARQMSRMFGTASYLTIVINDALGEETDINPFLRNPQTKKWHYNPNFMRIHAGPLDISLLGPYDAMLRIASLPILLGINRGQDFSSLRTLVSAPATSTILEGVTNQNSIGERTWWKSGASVFEIAQHVGEFALDHITPFAWGELIWSDPGRPSIVARGWESLKSIKSEPLEGTIGAAAAVGQTVGQVFGVKSSYESVNETLNEAFADVLENMTLEQKKLVLGERINVEQMTSDQIEDEWKKIGQSWWRDVVDTDGWGGNVKLSFTGALREPLPRWELVAADQKKVIKQMIRDGVFAEFMTPEELLDLEERIRDRREASKSDYDQLKLELGDIDEETLGYLNSLEEAVLKTHGVPGEVSVTVPYSTDEEGKVEVRSYTLVPGDLAGIMKRATQIRASNAAKRHALTSPQGRYSETLKGLFGDDKGREYSALDFDIYNAAQNLYYEDFYNESVTEDGERLPSIVDKQTGGVDWDLRDRKIVEWTRKLQKLFPHLTEEGLRLYLHRVEDSAAKDAPPMVGALTEAQKTISRAPMVDGKTFYELEDIFLDRLLEQGKRRNSDLTSERVAELHKAWQEAKGTGRRTVEQMAASEGIYGFEEIGDQVKEVTDSYFRGRGLPRTNEIEFNAEKVKRAYQESLLVLLNKRYRGDTWPSSGRARTVRDIMDRHLEELVQDNRGIGGTPFIRNLAKFVLDVTNPQRSEEDLRLEYWDDRLQSNTATASPAGSRP